MQLCIDAADDVPGIALSVDGDPQNTLAWETQRNHSVELLPNIERLLTDTNRTKADIEAVFVDLGPGGYAALRVGVSIAKGLAHGLGVPIVGVGRLELDAWSAARNTNANTRRVVAIHRAGRGELAFAVYTFDGSAWSEVKAPSIVKAAASADLLQPGDLLTGDIDDEVRGMADARGASIAQANEHRVVALAQLGHQRLTAGRADDVLSLVPMYLRAPAIGPQR